MFPQMLQFHMVQRGCMRRLQHDRGGFPRLPGLLPPCRANAPTVARLQPRKFIFRPRRRKIVSRHSAELKKLGRDLGADRMTAEIRLVPLATSRPRESRQWIHRAHFQRRPQNIPLVVSLRNHLRICRPSTTGAIGKRTENPSIRGRKIHAPWSTPGARLILYYPLFQLFMTYF